MDTIFDKLTDKTFFDLTENKEFFATVAIENADIIALHTTPVDIVAALGTNLVAVPTRMVGFNDYDTATYGGAAPIVSLLYEGGATLHTFSNAWAVSAVDLTQMAAEPVNPAMLANTKLQIESDAAITDPGTAVGILRIGVFFKIIDLTELV